MSERVPGSERTREALNDLMNGRLRVADAKSELVRLATRLIIEEGLEAEVRDALERGYYQHGEAPGRGHRNGVRQGHLKTAEGFIDYSAPQVCGTAAPFRSELRGHLTGHSEALGAAMGDVILPRLGEAKNPHSVAVSLIGWGLSR